jgi:hypothetical protein
MESQGTTNSQDNPEQQSDFMIFKLIIKLQ